jgi:xanthine dehydrogenase accessory factor
MAVAAEVIAGAPFALRRYGVADAAAWEVGLPCGGEIEVMVQPVTLEGFDPALFDAVADAREAGRGLAVATDLATGRSSLDPLPDAFINRYEPPRRLLIVGAVQIAQVLAGLAHELGIATVVIDPRGRFLTAERFPGVTLDDRWPDEAVAALRPDGATAVVTLSHDPKIDDPALIAALKGGAGYVAALGSRKSHAARRARLAEAGLTAEQIDRVEGPAGIDIGAVGPAEIALSIAAGMVRALHA